MKRLTVGQLIEDLSRFDKDKLVFIDDEFTGGHTTLEGAYLIESINKPEQHGNVYLMPTDE